MYWSITVAILINSRPVQAVLVVIVGGQSANEHKHNPQYIDRVVGIELLLSRVAYSVNAKKTRVIIQYTSCTVVYRFCPLFAGAVTSAGSSRSFDVVRGLE